MPGEVASSYALLDRETFTMYTYQPVIKVPTSEKEGKKHTFLLYTTRKRRTQFDPIKGNIQCQTRGKTIRSISVQ